MIQKRDCPECEDVLQGLIDLAHSTHYHCYKCKKTLVYDKATGEMKGYDVSYQQDRSMKEAYKIIEEIEHMIKRARDTGRLSVGIANLIIDLKNKLIEQLEKVEKGGVE